MGFSRASSNSFKEEKVLVDQAAEATKLLGTSFMASSIKGNNNNNQTSNSTCDQTPLLFQHQQHHQIQGHHHHLHQHPNQIPYNMINQSSSSSSLGNFISKDSNSSTGAYDLGELDQALFLYLDGQDHQPSNNFQDHHHHQRRKVCSTDQNLLHSTFYFDRILQPEKSSGGNGMRPPTLNIFPSQPMHAVEPASSTKGSPPMSGSINNSKRPSDPSSMELVNSTRNDNNSTAAPSVPDSAANKAIKREGNNRKGPTSSSEQEGPKTPDPKTLRRLAQNREAARKSRLRKKAYVQQLESSRIKLTQLEQELQRARAQGMFFNGGALVGGEQGLPIGINNTSQEAVVFDMEYGRWQEEQHRLMCELRAAVQEHLPENELRIFVENCLAHYDQMMNLKSMVAKSDVFHLVSGMWKTPAERCFMWMGGFRPSELIKIILSQIEPLTEQQILGICGLQQSTQEAEEALSQGLESLNQSLSDTITSDSLSCPPNMANYMGQMAVAMNKLSTVEGFVRQADNLRHQTLHRLHQLLTTRQAARCLLAIGEYFHRLRALSSLWLTRSRQE